VKSTVVTKALPERVWAFFRESYGEQGKKAGCKYRILSVLEGHSLTVQWKTLFARLIFTHQVTPHPLGSEISYLVEIRGFFSFGARYFLKRRIQRSLDSVLQQLAKKLDAVS